MLKNELSNNNTLIKIQDFNANNETHEGILYLASETRICYLNDVIEKYVNTGDSVLYYNKKLYYKGRVNKLCKISGKLINLNLLEKVSMVNFKKKTRNKNKFIWILCVLKVCKLCDLVEDCVVHYYESIDHHNHHQLILFVNLTREYLNRNEQDCIKELMAHIDKSLPSHYKPDKILILKDAFPINRNGIIVYRMLKLYEEF